MAGLLLHIMQKTVTMTDLENDNGPYNGVVRGAVRSVVTTRREIAAKTHRVVLQSDVIMFSRLAKALGAAYRRGVPAPDNIPPVYVRDYERYLQSVWLASVIAKALSVASHRFADTFHRMIDPYVPEFTSTIFVGIVDLVVDATLNRPSSHHHTFAGLPQLDRVFVRIFGYACPELIIQNQMWMASPEENAENDIQTTPTKMCWVTTHEDAVEGIEFI